MRLAISFQKKGKPGLDELAKAVRMAGSSRHNSYDRFAAMLGALVAGAGHAGRAAAAKCACDANRLATNRAAKCRARKLLQTARRRLQAGLEGNSSRRTRASLSR